MTAQRVVFNDYDFEIELFQHVMIFVPATNWHQMISTNRRNRVALTSFPFVRYVVARSIDAPSRSDDEDDDDSVAFKMPIISIRPSTPSIDLDTTFAQIRDLCNCALPGAVHNWFEFLKRKGASLDVVHGTAMPWYKMIQ